MKKGLAKILLAVGAIAALIYLECAESSYKNIILQRIAMSLYENAFLASKMEPGPVFVRIVTGNQLLFLKSPQEALFSQEALFPQEKLAKGSLIYRENQSGTPGTGEQLAEAENEAELYSSGDASAVAGENLAQVQAMAGSGTAAYVNKLRENKDVNYLWNHFYIIDSTTSVTKRLFPVEEMLSRNMTLKQKPGKKQILIYHTHGASEAFADSRKGKEADSVVGVGEVLAKELEKNGYGVYHDKTRYDQINGSIDRSKAYNASLEGIQRIMGENPDIQVTIDLHRDSVGKNKQTYTVIDGKRTAIVMLFNGMSRTKSGNIDYLYNPNLLANLSFSLQLKCHAMETYEGFTKPIYLKGYRYNLHVTERALLVELGNENNTVEEAKNAAAPLAKVITDVLKGEVNGF